MTADDHDQTTREERIRLAKARDNEPGVGAAASRFEPTPSASAPARREAAARGDRSGI
jgi:hypothetical protein